MTEAGRTGRILDARCKTGISEMNELYYQDPTACGPRRGTARLFAGTATIGLICAFAAPAYAQATRVAAIDEVAAGDEEIVVTGSLIKNANLERSAPVLVTTADAIELKQSNVAEEVLRELPGVVPNIGSAVNNGNGGASFVDLRGLNSNRNIVLLDGNRLPSAGLVSRVDLNNIPLALIERVESLTGGASTTYGADAVTGVVNFITKQNFSGLDISASEQITEQGDGNTFRTDMTIGGNFDDGKGNVVLSIGYQEADPVYQGARDFSAVQIESFAGTLGGSGTAIPSRFSGTRPIDPVTGQPSVDPTVVNGGVRQINTTTGQAVAPFAAFNFNPYNIFQTPFKRFNIFAQGKYEFTDNVEFYSRGMFSKNTVNTIVAPSGAFGPSVTIPLSNPYLPAALRNQFCAFNIAPVGSGLYTPRFTPAECTAAATATTTTNPAYRTVLVTVGRRTTEVGPRISEFVTQFFDYRAGLRGKLTASLDWDINGSYGESENRQALQGYVLTSRLRDAALATNTTTCLSGNAACVPVNLFGPEGSITAAQVNYLTGEASTLVKTRLAQARGTISGDIGVSSPWAEDAIGIAAGTEYRKYGATQRSDTLSQTVGELGGAGSAQPNINGGFDVWEGFGELVMPLIQERPFFKSLTLETGVRYSSYKVDAAGSPSFKTTTYKAGGSWEPVDGLKLRGNYSHAVRAPNISELFTPQRTVLTALSTDPCAGAAPLGNANLRAVCLAQGAPAGTIGSITNPSAGQANITTGGNLKLKPEKANTYTFGVVLQPTAVPGFSMTVDYYNIKVNGAITTPTSGDAVSACFANITAASASSTACTVIGRNSITGGLDGDQSITRGLFVALSNLGTLSTDGIDVTGNYSRDLGFAKLGLTGNFNYTASQKFRATPTSLNRECVGYYSVNCSFTGSLQPEFQWSLRSTLSFKQIDVSLLWRHIASLEQEPDDILNGNGEAFHGTAAAPFGAVDFRRIPAVNYFDLSTRIGVNDNLSLTVTVQNLLDKKPPLTGTDISAATFNSGNTYPSTYDTLGRRYAVQARLKF